MDRYKRMEQLNKALEGRALVWFGPRGSDALGLNLFTDHLGGSFSLYDRHFDNEVFDDRDFFVALEDFTLKRRLSRVFDEDIDSRVGELQFRRRVETCFKSLIVQGKIPTVIAYEPHAALDTIIMQDGVAEYLGIGLERFHEMSKKPLMERKLRERGVPVIPWKPVTEFEDVISLREEYDSLIIRRDGGSSGKGIVSLRQGDDVEEIAQVVREMRGSHAAAVSVAPLFEGAVSLNASAVVFPKKNNSTPAKVSTFPINAQLVGQPELTTLEFGYSGNDYAFTGGLDNATLSQCDEILVSVGEYLGETGYVGAFGVDFILTQQGQVLFTEVNARFQGSTRLLTRIAGRAGQSDVLMEHMAATLGLPFSPGPSAPQWSDIIAPFSQMYVHNNSGENICSKAGQRDEILEIKNSRNIPVTENVEYEMMPDNADITIVPGALVERVVVRGGVLSSDGRTLKDSAKDHLRPVNGRYIAVDERPLLHAPKSSEGNDLDLSI